MNKTRMANISLWLVPLTGLLAIILIPNLQELRGNRPSPRYLCQIQLKQMDGAKEQWALEHDKRTGEPATMSALVPDYIRTEPVCPIGGIYDVGLLGTPPTCSRAVEAHPAEPPSPSQKRLWIGLTILALPALFTVTCALWPARRKVS